MLCGVTATLGSNPSATATAARPHWGRAVLLCLRGVCEGLVAPTDLRPSRGLPARSPSAPRASLGASARSPARPCEPAGTLHTGGAWWVCPARPRPRRLAVRAASFARRVGSKPGQAAAPPAPRQVPPALSTLVAGGCGACVGPPHSSLCAPESLSPQLISHAIPL